MCVPCVCRVCANVCVPCVCRCVLATTKNVCVLMLLPMCVCQLCAVLYLLLLQPCACELVFAPSRRAASASGFRHCVYLGLKGGANMLERTVHRDSYNCVVVSTKKIKFQFVRIYVGTTLNVPLKAFTNGKHVEANDMN